MPDRIILTEDDIRLVQSYEGLHVRFMSLEGVEIVWDILDAEKLKQQILDDHKFYGKFHNEHVYSLTEEEFKKLTDKAERWDDRIKYIENPIKEIYKLEQEKEQLLNRCERMENETKRDKQIITEELDKNKQLKEEIDDLKIGSTNLRNHIVSIEQENYNLKEQLQGTRNEVISNLKILMSHTQKLEKIREWLRHELVMSGDEERKWREILDSQENKDE